MIFIVKLVDASKSILSERQLRMWYNRKNNREIGTEKLCDGMVLFGVSFETYIKISLNIKT